MRESWCGSDHNRTLRAQEHRLSGEATVIVGDLAVLNDGDARIVELEDVWGGLDASPVPLTALPNDGQVHQWAPFDLERASHRASGCRWARLASSNGGAGVALRSSRLRARELACRQRGYSLELTPAQLQHFTWLAPDYWIQYRLHCGRKPGVTPGNSLTLNIINSYNYFSFRHKFQRLRAWGGTYDYRYWKAHAQSGWHHRRV